MRRNTGLATALFAVASLAVGQQAPSAMDRINHDRARQMLRDAYNELKKHYYDLKYHGLDIDARYKEFDASMAKATSLSEGFGIVAGFLDGLQDSHTFFRPPPRPFRNDYGFRVQMYGDKAFIARVRPGTDAESKLHPGDQVLVWNNFEVTRDALWKMTYVFNAIAPQSVSRLTLRDPAGATREVVVQPFRQQQKMVLDVAGHNGESDIWQLIREDETADHLVRQRYAESEGAMIWKMPEFDMTDDQVDRMFAIVHKYPALILDLRGNPGGLVVTLERMLANVFDHDVKISDRIGRKELKPQMAKSRGGAYSPAGSMFW